MSERSYHGATECIWTGKYDSLPMFTTLAITVILGGSAPSARMS